MNFTRDPMGPLNVTNLQIDLIHDKVVKAFFCILYSTIFVFGIFGNSLVCYVVGRNRAMHTVTNCFITNLALSDILLCALAVPFTPTYTFLQSWEFGSTLCHLVPYAQGTSVYISSLTLTSIAIDRFFVIMYPFKPRMKLTTCGGIILSIWACSLFLTLPYGLYVSYYSINVTVDHTHWVSQSDHADVWVCEEEWETESLRLWFGGMTTTLQFIVPFLVISFCYIRVSVKLNDRARTKPGAKTSRKEEADRERKRRTNRMLIAMVTIFGVSWLPMNLFNVLNDMDESLTGWDHKHFLFFLGHAIAMSSTCYNPILYAWLNDNFRKEFKQVLPCFDTSVRQGSGRKGGNWKSERTCNGNDTCQETLLPTSVIIPSKPFPPLVNLTDDDDTRGNRLKSQNSVEVVLVAYSAGEDAVHIAKIDEERLEKAHVV